MPKLNTTIDNLEWKSNKIISTSTVSPNSWTDAQYPSAKTLLNIAHPVGSILTTSTNVNPAATLGGTWELVDKAFKDLYITLDSTYWTATNATIGEASNVLLADHSIAIRLNLIASSEFNDESKAVGTLNLAKCGISSLSYSVNYCPIISDLGNCVMSYKITSDGAISMHEVLNVNDTHVMPSGSDFFINLTQPINSNKMLDDFCDKFYWKRTA
jgi:hypothetical protein